MDSLEAALAARHAALRTLAIRSTDAAKLAAIRALIDNPPGRVWVGVDELQAVLDDAEPHNPVESMKRCGYQPPLHRATQD